MALVSLAPQAQPFAEAGPVVRVQILDAVDLGRPTLEAVGSNGTIHIDGMLVETALQGERIQLSRDGSRVDVLVAGQRRSGREVRFDASEIRVQTGRTDRRYPSQVTARIDGGALKLVNHAPMELYVASVVASELNFPEIEAAKAQAVLARTYASRRRGHNAAFDVFDDQRSQVYRGLATTTSTSRRAAQDTAGETLTYNGEIADAYYFSSSGGHTANNESIWAGAPIPYLRGVPDPYDTVSPDHTWRTSAPKRDVLRRLSSQYGGSVRGVHVERRSYNGRVLSVRLEGANRETITGSQFRRAVNAAVGRRTVRSTRYDISLDGDRYVFSGGGFGHGVGMSQFGAVGQARAGRSYREILAHYFVGTDVSGGTGPMVARAGPSPRAAPSSPADVQSAPRSALRTRYHAPSGRRWPTPRREAQAAMQAPSAGTTPASIASEPSTPETRPVRRRTAW